MTINARTKGQCGEREIAKVLNQIVSEVRKELELPQYETRDELFQRNQNQTAVGGSDLSNPLGLDIEVKRQEVLSISSWWQQTNESAKRQGGIPILIFRQNRKAWRVCMKGGLCEDDPSMFLAPIRVEITFDDFKAWFRRYYKKRLSKRII